MSSVINEVQNAPETFTSWDKCMDKAYCKWPAIIGIVVGSLILLSVLFCLVQCLCCGISCAKMLCCCCNGCDCGGKDKRRGRDERPSRFKDDYQQLPPPNPYAGYHPPPAMVPSYRGVPATATFEDSKGGDALPAMPSWDNATTHRVEVNEPEPRKTQDVEMGHLNPRQARGGHDQPLLSPASPTGAVPGYFANHSPNPYQSSTEIGTTKMTPQSTGYSQGFEPAAIPASPAPTYQTHAHQPSSGDRFMAGAASPAPHHYQQPEHNYSSPNNPAYFNDHHDSWNHPTNRDNTFSPPPAGTAITDSYAPRSNTFSPPPAGTMPAASHSYQSYDYAPAFESQTSPKDARPPSLLQVGRKAVPGSRREV